MKNVGFAQNSIDSPWVWMMGDGFRFSLQAYYVYSEWGHTRRQETHPIISFSPQTRCKMEWKQIMDDEQQWLNTLLLHPKVSTNGYAHCLFKSRKGILAITNSVEYNFHQVSPLDGQQRVSKHHVLIESCSHVEHVGIMLYYACHMDWSKRTEKQL